MITAILLGIASSLATEAVTWLNKKLSGTVLQGLGAFILSFVISLAIAFGVAVTQPGFALPDTWGGFVGFFGMVFTASQVWFMLITQKLGLVVTAPIPPAPPPAPAPAPGAQG